MTKRRRKFTDQFEAKVALEAMRGDLGAQAQIKQNPTRSIT
jgi:hypothetical protein